MIKAFIIVATSADGFIARNDSELSTQWTSKDDLARFIELTKRAKVVVMGSKTFLTMPKPLKNRLNIVYSRSQNFDQSNDPERIVETTNDDPAVLLKKLEDRGYTEVAICGGAEIYEMFMGRSLVDKIYQTIEPVSLGSGIPSLVTAYVAANPSWNKDKQIELPTGTIFIDYSRVN
jgi:dihydrofolate reductase